MRSAEGGEEIIQRYFVPQVVDDNGQRNALPAFCVHQIVGADTEVEDVAWFHTIGIVIVILLAGLRKRQQLRCDHAVAAVIGG